VAKAMFPKSFRSRSKSFRSPERRTLRGPVPLDFEQFYRASLRYRHGARLKSMEVAKLYEAWAIGAGAPYMSLKQIRRAMLNIGHSHFNSNGMYYGDVAPAEQLPDVADNFPSAGVAEPASARPGLAVVERIDAVMTELANIRREVLA
jgi:hypothetical protein